MLKLGSVIMQNTKQIRYTPVTVELYLRNQLAKAKTQTTVNSWGTDPTRQLPSQVKGLLYVEVLKGGQSSFHVQTTLLVFQCCEATGALEGMFWEIWQKLAKLYRTEDVLLTTKDGILQTGCTCEDGLLQSDDNRKQDKHFFI